MIYFTHSDQEAVGSGKLKKHRTCYKVRGLLVGQQDNIKSVLLPYLYGLEV